MPLARPILARLLDLLDIQGPDDCWLWKGRVHKSGYAYISKGGKGGAMLLMHRVSWCEHNNCPVPEGDAGNSKLTEDLVRLIRADERSQRTIAAELGVDQTLISMIKLRKVWAHVT